LSLYLLLSFQCYGDHRDLHSFPTRRSSDLDEDDRADRAREILGNDRKREPGGVVAEHGLPGESEIGESLRQTSDPEAGGKGINARKRPAGKTADQCRSESHALYDCRVFVA